MELQAVDGGNAPLHVLVIGATGSIGRHVVREALAAGHTVRALVRDPGKAHLDERIEVVVGDFTDPSTVRGALASIDAVVWAAGASRNTPDQVPLFETAARVLVEAMREQSVRRLVALSGAAITVEGERKPLLDRLMVGVVKLAARSVYEAKLREFEVFTSSGLDWTLIRPPRVVDGDATGRAIVGDQLVARQVTAGDVGAALVWQLRDSAQVHAAPYVSAPGTG